jgi:hypothetical protein
VERDGNGLRIRFANAEPDPEIAESALDIGIFSADGKPLARKRAVGGEAFLPLPGMRSGLYLLRVEAPGIREWHRFVLP